MCAGGFADSHHATIRGISAKWCAPVAISPTTTPHNEALIGAPAK